MELYDIKLEFGRVGDNNEITLIDRDIGRQYEGLQRWIICRTLTAGRNYAELMMTINV